METQKQSISKNMPKYTRDEEKASPNALPPKSLAILGVCALAIVVGILYSFTSNNPIKLISPANNASLAASDLEFTWNCNKKDGVSFVIEVYDGAELVMRPLIDGKEGYKPQKDELARLMPNHTYAWIVQANPDVPQKYKLKTSEKKAFTITKGIELPVPENQPSLDNKQPSQQQLPSQQPLPRQQPDESPIRPVNPKRDLKGNYL